MTRMVLYVAAPLHPTDEETDQFRMHEGVESYFVERSYSERVQLSTRANLDRAMRWLTWLRRSFPEVTFIAPWISAVLAGADDADEAQREAGLVDVRAVVERCDGIVLVGSRVSDWMHREMEHGKRRDGFKVYDLTSPKNGDTPLTNPMSMIESLDWLADVAARYWR